MELDHVIVAVSDLEAACATFGALLGQAPALRSEHPAFGTRNALFLFERGPYLELIAFGAAAPESAVTESLRAFLDGRGEGLFGVALAPVDLDAAVERLRSAGVHVPEPIGGQGTGEGIPTREWRSTILPSSLLAGAFGLLLEHRGWDWRGSLRPGVGDARRVRSIHHVVVDSEDAGRFSDRWVSQLGLALTERIESERMGALVNVHQAGEATIESVSATAADGPVARRMASRGQGLSSIAFEVGNLALAVEAARDGGLVVGDPAPGVLPGSMVARVEPASAHGVAAQLLHIA